MPITRYIKNWAVYAKFQVLNSHLLLCRLTGNRSELPNFSYTQPILQINVRPTDFGWPFLLSTLELHSSYPSASVVEIVSVPSYSLAVITEMVSATTYPLAATAEMVSATTHSSTATTDIISAATYPPAATTDVVSAASYPPAATTDILSATAYPPAATTEMVSATAHSSAAIAEMLTTPSDCPADCSGSLATCFGSSALPVYWQNTPYSA